MAQGEDRSRWSAAARLERLERHARDQARVITQQREQVRVLRELAEQHTRQLRDLRARLEQLDQRERWVDAYRADTGPDPFHALGAPELERERNA